MTRPPFKIPKGAKYDLRTGTWFMPFIPSRDGIMDSVHLGPGGQVVPGGYELDPPKLSLSRNERGAIIVDPIEGRVDRNQNIFLRETVTLSAASVKAALLFFDKLDYLDLDLGSHDFSAKERIEIDQVTERRRMAPMRDHPTNLSDGYYLAWQAREQSDPGAWSLWADHDTYRLPENEQAPGLGLRLRIQDCLVVPHADTEIHDILSFKERRRSELIALRHHIEDTVATVARDGFDAAVSRTAAERLEHSIGAYLQTLREQNWRKSLLRLDVDMDWSEAVRSAIESGGTAAVGTFLATGSLGPALHAFGIGAFGGLSIKSVAGKKKTSSSPYAYLGSIVREL